jgi:hypothetical protein
VQVNNAPRKVLFTLAIVHSDDTCLTGGLKNGYVAPLKSNFETMLAEVFRASLEEYVEYGTDPGEFLRRVLANQLTEAALAADDLTKPLLADVALAVHHTVPADARGDIFAVHEWMNHKGAHHEYAD